MPSLYSGNVSVGNTTGLYQQPTGNVQVLSSAAELLTLLDNNGNVNFALDPVTGNSTIYSFFVGNTGGGGGGIPLFTMTGDVVAVGTIGTAINSVLSASGATAGTYGDSTHIPVLTVDSKGRVTNITSVAAAGGGGSSYGNANVAAYLPTYTGNIGASYINLTQTISGVKAVFTGNVQGNYILGDGSKLTNLPSSSYGNTQVAAFLPTYTGIVTAGAVKTDTYLFANGQPFVSPSSYGNTQVAAYLPTDSTIIGLQSNAATQEGEISSLQSNAASQQTQIDTNTGNISTLFSNAATQATAISGLQSNAASQQTQIDTNTSGLATLNANVGAFETYANTHFGTNSYSNVNVAGYLAGNISVGNIQAYSGDFLYGLTTHAGAQTTLNGTVIVNGQFQDINGATSLNMTTLGSTFNNNVYIGNGNVTITPGQGYFIGNGSLLTNLPIQTGTYSNTNVAAYLPTYNGTLTNSSTIVDLYSNAATQASAITTLQSNAASQATDINTLFSNAATQATSINSINANVTAANAAIATKASLSGASFTGAIYTTANITANAGAYFIGDGSLLTNLPASSYGNTQVAAYLPTYNGNIGTLGSTGINRYNGGNVFVKVGGYSGPGGIGDQSRIDLVAGNATSTVDGFIALQARTVYVTNGTAADSKMVVTMPLNVDFTAGGISSGNLNVIGGNVISTLSAGKGGYFIGDGSKLTNLPSSSYGNANVAAYLPTYSGNIGNSGAVGNVYATIRTASQPGIGTLDNVSQIGNASAPPALSIYGQSILLQAGTPGSNVSVNTTGTGYLNILSGGGGIKSTANVQVDSGYYFIGDGSKLTGIASGTTFSGNLAGNTLVDSTNLRIFANAYPQSPVYAATSANPYVYVTTKPVYSGPYMTPTGSATTGLIVQGNTLITTGAGSLRTTVLNTVYHDVFGANTTMNANDRVRTIFSALNINLTNNQQWGTATNVYTIASVGAGYGLNVTGNGFIQSGTAIGAQAFVNPYLGSANVQVLTGINSTVGYQTIGTGAVAGNIAVMRGFGVSSAGGMAASYTAQKAIGYHVPSAWVNSSYVGSGQLYAFLNEDGSSVIQTNGNVAFTNYTQPGTIYNFAQKQLALGNVSGTVAGIAPSTASVVTMTATGNITINSGDITPMNTGQSITLIITQDATGGWTLTSDMKFAGGSKTLSTAASAIDVINIYYDGTNKLCALVKGYA